MLTKLFVGILSLKVKIFKSEMIITNVYQTGATTDRPSVE